jgi:hypothetical protein
MNWFMVAATFPFLLLSFLLGAWRERRRAVKPICGCKHHLAMHDPGTLMCNFSRYNSDTGRQMPCGCKRYIGPDPDPMLMITSSQLDSQGRGGV